MLKNMINVGQVNENEDKKKSPDGQVSVDGIKN